MCSCTFTSHLCMCQIWNTAKKAGKKVATMMWVGSSINIQGALVVSVAQLVARGTNNRKVVGSIPANRNMCFTVDR